MQLVLAGVNRHNFVTRWNFISIFLTLKVFCWIFASCESSRPPLPAQIEPSLRINVSTWKRKKHKFLLRQILSDILRILWARKAKGRKSFSSCLTRSNENLIFFAFLLLCDVSLLDMMFGRCFGGGKSISRVSARRREVSSAPARSSFHQNKIPSPRRTQAPKGIPKVDQKVTYLVRTAACCYTPKMKRNKKMWN